MAKIYFLRHQAAGLISKYPFSDVPTDVQIDAVKRECFQLLGPSHPKTGEPYWLKVVEQDVLGPGDVPDVPERALSSVSPGVRATGGGDPEEFTVQGVGTVTNPDGSST